MKIGDVHTTTSRPDPLRGGPVGDSGQEKVGAVARIHSDGPSASSKDRIEISQHARNAAQADGRPVQELVMARKALLELPSLTGERAAHILERIQDGHYSQPEVLERVAKRFTEELTGSL